MKSKFQEWKTIGVMSQVQARKDKSLFNMICKNKPGYNKMMQNVSSLNECDSDISLCIM